MKNISELSLAVGDKHVVDAWSNTIVDDAGEPLFRLLAISVRNGGNDLAALTDALTEKDTLLKELQHRVKNNLQMLTALIRMEARNAERTKENASFNRLAGRIEALSILYRSLYSGARPRRSILGPMSARSRRLSWSLMRSKAYAWI